MTAADLSAAHPYWEFFVPPHLKDALPDWDLMTVEAVWEQRTNCQVQEVWDNLSFALYCLYCYTVTWLAANHCIRTGVPNKVSIELITSIWLHEQQSASDLGVWLCVKETQIHFYLLTVVDANPPPCVLTALSEYQTASQLSSVQSVERLIRMSAGLLDDFYMHSVGVMCLHD